MSEKRSPFKGLALLFCIFATSVLLAAPVQFEGQVLDAEALTPVEGARVWLQDADRSIVPTGTTDAEGGFEAISVAPDTYRVAVEVDGTLYTVDRPLTLDEETPYLRIAVPLAPAVTQDDDDDDEEGYIRSGKPTGWSNPGVAAAVVVGGAFVLGWIIDSTSSDDNTPASAVDPTLTSMHGPRSSR